MDPVQFLIAPILFPLKLSCNDTFLIYMIDMLLLFCKKASYLAVRIAKSLSATMDLRTLPQKPVKHNQLASSNVID
jgi:hypothetical protein